MLGLGQDGGAEIDEGDDEPGLKQLEGRDIGGPAAGGGAVVNEDRAARIGGVAVNRIEHWEFADRDPDDDEVEKASYETTSVYGFGHPLYYDNVIKSLRGEAMPDTDGREGLHSLEILIATYLSARDGRRVALPLEY